MCMRTSKTPPPEARTHVFSDLCDLARPPSRHQKLRHRGAPARVPPQDPPGLVLEPPKVAPWTLMTPVNSDNRICVHHMRTNWRGSCELLQRVIRESSRNRSRHPSNDAFLGCPAPRDPTPPEVAPQVGLNGSFEGCFSAILATERPPLQKTHPTGL
jgi:hypothetical protein